MKYGDNAHRTTRALQNRHIKLCRTIEKILEDAQEPLDTLHNLLDIERELTLREHE